MTEHYLWDWLSSGGVQDQSDQRGQARVETVVGKKGKLELILTHHMLCNRPPAISV